MKTQEHEIERKRNGFLKGIASFLLSATLSGLVACAGLVPPPGAEEAEETEESTDQKEDAGTAVESTGRNLEYVYFHTCEGTHKEDDLSELMSVFTGRVVVADPEKHFPVDWDNDATIPEGHDPTEISAIKEENGNPDEYDCVLSTTAPEAGTFTTDGKGTDSLPAMDENWAGYGSGGCGTWATAMCNRILGESDGEVTQDEWNGIAGGIGQNAGGGSSMSNQSKYYEDMGYCVSEKKFGGSEGDYQEMEDEIDDDCDVKLFFWSRNADGTFSNGHVETVTGASSESGSCTTNSWGEEATVSGGDDGDFSHSRDGSAFRDAEGNALWPADGTEVWVQYVCECSVLESIGKLLGL